jgi:two-component system KDP operon response regulator KdpE
MARLRVALRHRASTADTWEIHVGTITIDFDRRVVERQGQLVRLTPIEYDLLRVLALNVGRVMTHRHLLHEVWGDASYETDGHYLRIYIGHLRKKIETDPTRPQLIITEPGVGYRLVDPDAQ